MKYLLLALLCLSPLTAWSQQMVNPCTKVGSNNCVPVTASAPLPVTSSGGSVSVAPATSAGNYAAKTITNSSTEALAAAAGGRVFLDIINESASATIACALGATAVINGAGSITIPPLWHHSWDGSFVPSDAVNCISSVASSTATIGAK